MKRNRVPLSCTPCRGRKLKCNRESPCQNCIAHDEVSSCAYAQNMTASSKRQMIRPPVTRPSNSAGLPDNHDYAITAVVEESSGNPAYRGGTHWLNIMQELSTVDPSLAENSVIEGDSKPVVISPPPSKRDNPRKQIGDLQNGLPSPEALMELLESFFKPDLPLQPSAHVVHRPSIMKQCEAHWKNPSRSPISWVGLIFAIGCVSVQTLLNIDSGAMPILRHVRPSRELVETYRTRAYQCISLADSLKPNMETLTTMIFLSVARFTCQVTYEGDDTTLFESIGGIVRTALRMGFHRDPSHFPNITPFECEMRRRVWAFVKQMDYLSSFSLGLPAIVRTTDSDTKNPLNVCDSDLDENMVELPPEKPPSYSTTICYLIAKNRLLHVIGCIMEHLHSLRHAVREEVLQLDRDLCSAHEVVPLHLKLTAWEDILQDEAYKIVQKMRIDLLFHEGMCALHRRYLKSDPKFSLSKRRCITSSMTLLCHHEVIYREMRHGGRLEHARWYNLTATNDGFALATAILCLHLQHERNSQHTPGSSRMDEAGEHYPNRKEILERLDISRDTWSKLAAQSTTARRVARLLDIMLGSFHPRLRDPPQLHANGGVGFLSNQDLADRSPPFSAISPRISLPQTHEGLREDDLPFIDIMDLNFEDFDWNSWGSFLESASDSFSDAFGVTLTPDIDNDTLGTK